MFICSIKTLIPTIPLARYAFKIFFMSSTFDCTLNLYVFLEGLFLLLDRKLPKNRPFLSHLFFYTLPQGLAHSNAQACTQ